MVDIKTEIPKESSGRLLDALTDIIRPFSEKKGLKADRIRLQREEVLVEIARRAKQRAELESLSVQPVPNKVLVPLLEAASNEELDSQFLEWWSNLLLTSAQPGARHRPYFTDVISKLGPSEAQLLEQQWGLFPKAEDSTTSLRVWLRPRFEQLIEGALEASRRTTDEDWHAVYERELQIASANFRREWEGRGVLFPGIRLKLKGGGTSTGSKLEQEGWISVEVCKALQILEETSFSCEADAIDLSNQVHTVTYVTFTELGIEFMKATHRT
jgi:hypothetical protein